MHRVTNGLPPLPLLAWDNDSTTTTWRSPCLYKWCFAQPSILPPRLFTSVTDMPTLLFLDTFWYLSPSKPAFAFVEVFSFTKLPSSLPLRWGTCSWCFFSIVSSSSPELINSLTCTLFILLLLVSGSPSHSECLLLVPSSPSHSECLLLVPSSPSHSECLLLVPSSPSHSECLLLLTTWRFWGESQLYFSSLSTCERVLSMLAKLNSAAGS